MSLRIISSNIIAESANAVTTPNSFETLVITEGTIVASAGGNPQAGILVTGSDHNIFVDGSVIGALGISSDAVTSPIFVGVTGRVIGSLIGIFNTQSGGVISNAGRINGLLTGINQTVAGRIENTGTIEGQTSVEMSVGNDVLVNSGLLRGAVKLNAGDDRYDGLGGRVDGLIDLGLGNDTAFGGDWRDHFADGAGRDEIDGGAGDDLLDVAADTTADTFDGGAGVDTLRFLAAGTSTLTVDLRSGTARSAATGSDLVAGFEHIMTGDGNNRLTGNDSENVLRSGSGTDVLIGGEGDDRLYGGDGLNTLTGDDGNDRLFGGGARDSIIGGNGNDYIFGAFDTDRMSGGAGLDTFVWREIDEFFQIGSALPRDQIIDFTPGQDRIDLSQIDAIPGGSDNDFVFLGLSTLTAAGQVAIRHVGANTFVDVSYFSSGAAGTILLNGILTLTEADFVL